MDIENIIIIHFEVLKKKSKKQKKKTYSVLF